MAFFQSASLGVVGLVGAIAGVISMIVTASMGAHQQASAPVDYSKDIGRLNDHMDKVRSLRDEYLALSQSQDGTAGSGRKMDEIIQKLAGSSITLRDALTDSTGGIIEQGEAIRTVNEYLRETAERVNSLKREQAGDSFKALDGVDESRQKIEEAKRNMDLWDEYQKYMQTDERKRGRGFADYAGDQMDRAGNANSDQYLKWLNISEKVRGMADAKWYESPSLERVDLAMSQLDATAQETFNNANEHLESLKGDYLELLKSFAMGPEFDTMGAPFQKAMMDYFNEIGQGIDMGSETLSDDLFNAAAKLKARQSELYNTMMDDKDLQGLFKQYDDMMANPKDMNLDALNALIDQINDIIAKRNEIKPDETQLSLLPHLTASDVQQIQSAGNEIAALSENMDVYFAKLRKNQDEQKAKDNLYVDQVKQLRQAWMDDPSGKGFSERLAQMYADSPDIVDGMMQQHEAMLQLADGTLDYADGLKALDEMMNVSTRKSQLRTQQMIQEAEATKAVEAARQDNYQSILASLQTANQKGESNLAS